MRAFADAGIKVVANLKPCLLDDHPRYGEAAAAGVFVGGARRRAVDIAVLGRRGRASSTSPIPPASRGGRTASDPRRFSTSGSTRDGTTTTNTGSSTTRRPARASASRRRSRCLRPIAGAADDPRDARGATRREADRPPVHGHARRRPGYPALRPDLERRQHDELGARSNGTFAPASACRSRACSTSAMTSAASRGRRPGPNS